MNRWSSTKAAIAPWIVPGVVWLLGGLITVQTGYLYAVLASPQSVRDPQFPIALAFWLGAGLIGGVAPAWQVRRALERGQTTRTTPLIIAGGYLALLVAANCALEAARVGDVLARIPQE